MKTVSGWDNETPPKGYGQYYMVLSRSHYTKQLHVSVAQWWGQYELNLDDDCDYSLGEEHDGEVYAKGGWYLPDNDEENLRPVEGDVLAWHAILPVPDSNELALLGINPQTV